MPARKKIHKQDILEAAVRVIREHGASALSVRNIARELHVSTQPLYSEFENFDSLKEELLLFARERYIQVHPHRYKDFGLALLHFAKDEKELFKFIFIRSRDKEEQIKDVNYDLTIKLLSENLDMDTHSAKELHKKMQYYTYSMAVMIATGYRNISEEEMDRELTDIFKIMLRHYKQIDNEEECDHWLERARDLPE